MVPAFADFKDLDDVDPFNASGVDGGKESKQGRVVLYVTAIVKAKNHLVGNGQPVTVSLNLVEGVECNTTFSWPFLKTINESITT